MCIIVSCTVPYAVRLPTLSNEKQDSCAHAHVLVDPQQIFNFEVGTWVHGVAVESCSKDLGIALAYRRSVYPSSKKSPNPQLSRRPLLLEYLLQLCYYTILFSKSRSFRMFLIVAAAIAVLWGIGYLALDWLLDWGCEQPRIPYLPRIPGLPVVGNLLQLGCSQALVYRDWASQYGPVFQIRLGCKRVVVANSYSSAKALWIENMSANCSRPISYTFHKVVSTSQGYTIGTTPWSDVYKRKRKLAGAALNKPSVRSYIPFIDKESAYCIRSIVEAGALNNDFDIHPFFKTYAINTSLSLNYGTRLDRIDEDLLQEIIQVEKKIAQFRASLDSYQDYIPILRWIPNSAQQEAVECRQRRDRYMSILLNNLRREIQTGEAASCIAGNILQNPDSKVCEEDLKSICLTMVSAGLDTVPSTMLYFIGHMSRDYGQCIQRRAYESIIERYPDTAWNACLADDKIPYIQALVAETLRFSAMPISLPRETVKDIQYGEAVIPAHTRLLLNAFAANFDPVRFTNPFQFNPDRYMADKFDGPKHFTFGAGMRMCAGAALSERELYVAIVRLVISFKILPPVDSAHLMPCDPNVLFSKQTTLTVDPPPFKVRLMARNYSELSENLKNRECE